MGPSLHLESVDDVLQLKHDKPNNSYHENKIATQLENLATHRIDRLAINHTTPLQSGFCI